MANIQELLDNLSKRKDLHPLEAAQAANQIARLASDQAEAAKRREDYIAAVALYEKAQQAYLLAAQRLAAKYAHLADALASASSFWSLQAQLARQEVKRKPTRRFQIFVPKQIPVIAPPREIVLPMPALPEVKPPVPQRRPRRELLQLVSYKGIRGERFELKIHWEVEKAPEHEQLYELTREMPRLMRWAEFKHALGVWLYETEIKNLSERGQYVEMFPRRVPQYMPAFSPLWFVPSQPELPLHSPGIVQFEPSAAEMEGFLGM